MRLVRFNRPNDWFNTFDRLGTLQNQINQLFGSPLANALPEPEVFTDWAPALDVFEDKDNVIVAVELPGMKREEIQVSVHDGVLSVSGERKAETKIEGHVSRRERTLGRFSRAVTLPQPIDAGRVTAKFQDGVLTISLPKQEEAKPRQIEVKAN